MLHAAAVHGAAQEVAVPPRGHARDAQGGAGGAMEGRGGGEAGGQLRVDAWTAALAAHAWACAGQQPCEGRFWGGPPGLAPSPSSGAPRMAWLRSLPRTDLRFACSTRPRRRRPATWTRSRSSGARCRAARTALRWSAAWCRSGPTRTRRSRCGRCVCGRAARGWGVCVCVEGGPGTRVQRPSAPSAACPGAAMLPASALLTAPNLAAPLSPAAGHSRGLLHRHERDPAVCEPGPRKVLLPPAPHAAGAEVQPARCGMARRGAGVAPAHAHP